MSKNEKMIQALLEKATELLAKANELSDSKVEVKKFTRWPSNKRKVFNIEGSEVNYNSMDLMCKSLIMNLFLGSEGSVDDRREAIKVATELHELCDYTALDLARTPNLKISVIDNEVVAKGNYKPEGRVRFAWKATEDGLERLMNAIETIGQGRILHAVKMGITL